MTIVGYTYRADNYCPNCVSEQIFGVCYPEVEPHLDEEADAEGIDRSDESSFDSNDFPKIITFDAVDDDDRCGGCGDRLVA